jgi:hypothetical protein
MRVVDPRPRPVARVAHRYARRGGGTATAALPVVALGVDRVPDGVDAVLVTSDLQGVAPSPLGGEPVLLGLALADHLALWAAEGLTPPPERVAVVLAGDLYSAPAADTRGATGPVADVWLAFAAAGCPVVTGVRGNHDVIGPAEAAVAGPGLLDGTVADLGGVRVGGVCGVIGDPWRADRRGEADFLAALRAVQGARPDVVVLHEGPDGGHRDLRGNPVVRAALAADPPPLTVCGHIPWPRPLARLGAGHVLNTDGRAVLLVPA